MAANADLLPERLCLQVTQRHYHLAISCTLLPLCHLPTLVVSLSSSCPAHPGDTMTGGPTNWLPACYHASWDNPPNLALHPAAMWTLPPPTPQAGTQFPPPCHRTDNMHTCLLLDNYPHTLPPTTDGPTGQGHTPVLPMAAAGVAGMPSHQHPPPVDLPQPALPTHRLLPAGPMVLPTS